MDNLVYTKEADDIHVLPQALNPYSHLPTGCLYVGAPQVTQIQHFKTNLIIFPQTYFSCAPYLGNDTTLTLGFPSLGSPYGSSPFFPNPHHLGNFISYSSPYYTSLYLWHLAQVG